jgi:hypothetical protein
MKFAALIAVRLADAWDGIATVEFNQCALVVLEAFPREYDRLLPGNPGPKNVRWSTPPHL